MLKKEKLKANKEKRWTDLEITEYLETKIMPLLLTGMEELTVTKPENPITFIA